MLSTGHRSRLRWSAFLHLMILLAITTLLLGRVEAYNITVTDQSPLINYTPAIIGPNLTSAWNVAYDGVPHKFNNPTAAPSVGVGRSSHFTNAQTASISVAFLGTSIYALGNIQTNNRVADSWIMVDGTQYQHGSGDFLGSAENLTQGWHTATLRYAGDGTLTFFGFIFGMDLEGDTTPTNISAVASSASASANSAFTLSTNDWNITSLTGGDSHEVSTDNQFASLSFDTPANTSCVILYGAVTPKDASFSVTLSHSAAESIKVGGSSNKSAPSTQSITQDQNAQSPWIAGGIIQYFRQVDPSVAYNVKVIQTGPQGGVFSLGSVVFLGSGDSGSTGGGGGGDSTGGGGGGSTGNDGGSGSDSGGSSTPHKSSTNIGAIVGGAVGGAAALVILGVLIWFFRRRKRRQQENEKSADLRTLDLADDEHPQQDRVLSPTPFPPTVGAIDGADETSYDEKAAYNTLQPLSLPSQSGSSAIRNSVALEYETDPIYVPSTSREIETPTNSDRRSSRPLPPLPFLQSQQSPSQQSPRPLSQDLSPSQSQTDSRTMATIGHSSNGSKPAAELSSPQVSRPEPPVLETEGSGSANAPVHEIDAGRVEDNQTLPPIYNPSWRNSQDER